MTDPIPAADLPLVSPGATDYVVGVQLGNPRRFRLGALGTVGVGYATLTDLQAVTGLTYGSLRKVTNDPTPANNGTWRWDETDAWVQSDDDVSALEASVAALEAEDDALAAVQNGHLVSGAGEVFMAPTRLRGLAAWWEINDLSTLFSDYAGTTPAVVDGLVGHILDKSGNGKHLQFLDARRPYLRQDANGHYYLEGDNTARYGSVPSSAAYFKFMHDGTGCSACVVAAAESSPAASVTRGLLNTNGASATAAGFNLGIISDGSSDLYSTVRIGNGSASVINKGGNIGDFRADALAQHIIWTYKSQTGVDYRHYLDGSQSTVAGTAESNAPTSASSSADLFLFTSSAGSYFRGRFYGAILSNVVWNEDERQAAGRWALSLHGVGTYTLGVGDSHTYNTSYSQTLRDFHPAKLETLLRAEGYSRASVNKGISGDSTAEIIARLTNVLEAGSGDVAVLYAGTNDENAPTTVSASPTPTTTTFTVASANGYYAAGGHIFVGGEPAVVLSRSGSAITLAAPLSSAPAAGAAVTIDTRTNLIAIGRRLREAGFKKLVIGGMHYLNYATGGDEVGTPRAAGVTLRALQESAAQELDALYVDFHAYMEALLVAGTYTDGDDTAWHVAVGNSHLNNVGEQILADAILAAMQERGWA